MTAIVELDKISFVRGGKPILRDVSWRIDAGQHWALLGANGSGKTTLLKIISGYEWPTAGRVAVLGRTFGKTDLRALRREIGWVSTALSDRLPGHHVSRQIVASGFDSTLGLFREFDGAEWTRCDDALERVGAARVADQSFDTLSQGEQQRVRIARSLVNRPTLLILDEPCAGLDPVSRRDFLGDVAALARGGSTPTIVLVTHHVEEIGDWITHGLALHRGETVAAGPIADIVGSEVLSRTFGAACIVERNGEGYRLEFAD